jgi:hypothetical protein
MTGSAHPDRDHAASRQKDILLLAEAEESLRDIIARDHPLVRDGKVVVDPATGEPCLDDTLNRQAEAELAGIRQLRRRLTGLLPGDGDGDGDGDGGGGGGD